MRGIELDNFNGAAMPVLRMSVVRVLLLYLLVFMVATSLFSAFVYWHSASTLFTQTDSTLVWEARYFASFSGDALPKEIDRQLALERPINFFGLFEADGSHVAGDIVDLPWIVQRCEPRDQASGTERAGSGTNHGAASRARPRTRHRARSV
jgi:hypothetical protein